MDALVKRTLTPISWLASPTPTISDFTLLVKTLTGKEIELVANPADTVEKVKIRLQEEEGTPPNQQVLDFVGKQLKDGTALRDYNIGHGSQLRMVLRKRGGALSPLSNYMHPDIFDKKHNFDFTNHTQGDERFERGGRTYNRPYGWNRIGLNVKDKYGGERERVSMRKNCSPSSTP